VNFVFLKPGVIAELTEQGATMNYLTLILNLLLSLAVADGALTETSLIKHFPQEPLLNEIVIFEPVDRHKFNLEAPNFCGNGALVIATEKKIKCQMSAPGSSELQLYVCDDKKTYCRREELKIKTQQPSGILGWLKYYKKVLTNRDSWSTPERTDVSTMPLAKGFVAGNIQGLKEQIKKDKKSALIIFTQTFCEACRVFKEITLSSDEFQTATQGFVRYQVDFDVALPTDLRKLMVPGTPTLVVMNQDFKEVGRKIGGAAPVAVARWLKNLPSVPVETLAQKPIEKLSDDEKFQVSKWQRQHWDEEWTEKSRFYANAIKNPSAYMTLLESYNKTPEDLQSQLRWAVQNEGMALGITGEVDADLAKELYLGAIENLIYQSSGENNRQTFNQSLVLAQRMEKVIQKYSDSIERNWHRLELASIVKNSSAKLGLKKESEIWKEKALAAMDVLLKLPHIPQKSFLPIMRAEISGDILAQKKVMEDLRDENKDDYAYDFLAAQDAKNRNDLKGALAEIDKSLAVAKNRSWQKAVFFKVHLLRELKRSDEAVKLINDTLSKIQLPSDSSFPVHQFVQKLRREQLETGEIK
jgi:hypothetical protein